VCKAEEAQRQKGGDKKSDRRRCCPAIENKKKKTIRKAGTKQGGSGMQESGKEGQSERKRRNPNANALPVFGTKSLFPPLPFQCPAFIQCA